MNRYLIVAEHFDNEADKVDFLLMTDDVWRNMPGKGPSIHANTREEALAKAQNSWNSSKKNNYFYEKRDLIRFLVVEQDYIDQWGDKAISNDWPDFLRNSHVYQMFSSFR